jgi:hypothetical protein
MNQILLGTMKKWTHPLPNFVLGERPPIRMVMLLSQPRRESVRLRYRIGFLLRRAKHQRSPKYQLPLGVRLLIRRRLMMKNREADDAQKALIPSSIRPMCKAGCYQQSCAGGS